MKNKTRNLIIAVIVFLVGLIAIQFVWMYRAAVYQEKRFEYTVVAALNKAVSILNDQATVCNKVTECFNTKGISCCKKGDISYEMWSFIDSLIKVELSYSKIDIDYQFQLSVTPHPHPMINTGKVQHKCFTVKSNMLAKNENNIWLHITFPMRNKFILAQVGWLFIVSLMLIVLTIGAFILIYRYYLREKHLANDTRNFINNLTHEFKTPIASIRLANNRIVKATEGNIKTASYTKIINQENRKLEEHVNYLLDISRLQKGKMPMHCVDLDVHDLLLRESDTFRLQIEDRGGEINTKLNAERFIVNADCFHLTNAFNNIIDNANKYSEGAPKIVISTKNINGGIQIAFKDNAIGIDKAFQKTIFQEFSRVDTGNLHNVKGFGLGLSYVWQVVKMHKGSLKLESSVGEGSTFFIKLPLAEID